MSGHVDPLALVVEGLATLCEQEHCQPHHVSNLWVYAEVGNGKVLVAADVLRTTSFERGAA